MPLVRPPAFAGSFYPADPQELLAALRRALAAAPPPGPGPAPKALVVPHAGYVYSGAVAGAAYALLARAKGLKRIVLAGPSHHAAFNEPGLSGMHAFETPLGEVPLDREAVERCRQAPRLGSLEDPAHLAEHSLEVQLPFLQALFKDVPPIVPVLAPWKDAAAKMQPLFERLWGGPETLILISTDLSHYLPYARACELDGLTDRQILGLEAEAIAEDQACGAGALKGFLLAARAKGLTARRLSLCNSGDTAGDKRRVVGYGAYAFG